MITDERTAYHRGLEQSSPGRSMYDMLVALPYILVPRDEPNAVGREIYAQKDAAERRRVHDKVDG